MAITPPSHGAQDWDTWLNATLTTLDSGITAQSVQSTANMRLLRRGLFPPDYSARVLGLPTVMSSAPTVTVSNAGSTIGSSTRRSANDPAFTYLGAGMVDPGSRGGYTNCRTSGYLTSSLSVQGRLRVEFEIDADTFEIVVYTVTASNKYRILVDGQYVTSATPANLTNGGSIYHIKLAFGSRANRRILFEGQWLDFVGVWATLPGTIWKTTRPTGPKVLWIGDSFSEGTGADFWWSSWAMAAAAWLGWDVYPSAVGSTGYLADGGGGGKVKYRDRIAADVTALSPDIVVVTGGYNDTGVSSASAVGTEAGLLFTAIKSGNPNAALVVCAPNYPSGTTVSGNRTDIRDAIKTQADSAGAYWVDPVAYPTYTSWITGSGKVGSTVGDGNADYFTSSDGVHPSQAGHDYQGRRFAQAVAALV